MGRLTRRSLGGAGLGAHRQGAEHALSIGLLHIVAHHIPQHPAGVRVKGGLQRRRAVSGQGNAVHGGLLIYQPGSCGPAAGDGAQESQKRAGIHQIVVLAHTRPAQICPLTHGKLSGRRADAADGEALRQSGLFRISSQGLAPQLHRHLSIGAVAGPGQGIVQVHIPVGIGTGDNAAVQLQTPGAGEVPVQSAVQILQSRSSGHQLEHGARGKRGRQHPVQIHAVIPAVPVPDLRRVRRVKGGAGHHAQHVAGAVVVHRHGPLPAVQGLQGRSVQLCVNGQIYLVSSGGGTRQRVKAHQAPPHSRLGGGGNVVVPVAHHMERRPANDAVLCPAAGGPVIQKHPVAVQHLTQGQPPIPIGMVIGGEGGPLSAPHHIPHAEQHHARTQHSDQCQHQHGPQLYLFQDRPSFPNISSTGISGISSKNPSRFRAGFSGLSSGDFSSGGSRTSAAFR